MQPIPMFTSVCHRRRFFHISSNKLESVPYTLLIKQLEVIDLSQNAFSPERVTPTFYKWPAKINPSTLCEMAARIVTKHRYTKKNSKRYKLQSILISVNPFRIFYSPQTLPRTLIDIIEESPICQCGALCFSTTIQSKFHGCSRPGKNIISDQNAIFYTDCVFCSFTCDAARRFLKFLH